MPAQQPEVLLHYSPYLPIHSCPQNKSVARSIMASIFNKVWRKNASALESFITNVV